jgi:hypothetical protein
MTAPKTPYPPWDDILENAPLFAQALGIRVLSDE